MKRLKKLRGYTDQARFLAECEQDWLGRAVVREHKGCLGPDECGCSKTVLSYQGKPVVMVDGPGRESTVMELDLAMDKMHWLNNKLAVETRRRLEAEART